jgi:hypothetical protein
MRRLPILLILALVVTVLALASAASAAPPAKVDVCHFNSLGEWQVNTLRDKGEGIQAHLAHGDALPGQEVPGMADYEFNADCQPMLIPGSIVITKATNPAGGIDFGFTDNISAPNSFTLDDGQDVTFNNVVPGTYAVSETVPSGWDLTSATCDGGSTPSAIVVTAGVTVTCTFTNTVQNWQMATGHDDVAYKRLAATVDLTGAATASLDFSTSYGIETDWDYMFVEVHTVGADDWTTLPDRNGHTSQATGQSCPSSWALQLHPQLFHYQDAACNPTGTTGVWHATTGVSDGIEQWSIVLSAYAGSQVEVLISFATDWGTGDLGVFVDDVIVTVDGAVVSDTSFEDGLGDWTIPGAPDGSVANPNDWQRIRSL